jgi:hypothetical protein
MMAAACDPVAVVDSENWSGPRTTDATNIWPMEAFDEGVQGYGLLRCRAGAGGEALDCQIVKEQPAGWGFGAAALRASQNLSITSVPEGAWFVVPIRFCFPDEVETCPSVPQGLLAGDAEHGSADTAAATE